MEKVEAAEQLRTEVQVRIHLTAHPSLKLFWRSVEDSLGLLIRGEDEPADLMAFTIYESCEGMNYLQDFKEAWGFEIGQASGLITSLTIDLRRGMGLDNEEA